MALTINTPQSFAVPSGTNAGGEIAALDSTHFVQAYYDNSNSDLYVVVGTISGTTITYGTPQTVLTGGAGYNAYLCALTSTTFVLQFYNIVSGFSTPSWVAGTVSGTTITLGTIATGLLNGGLDQGVVIAMDSTHFLSCIYASGVSDVFQAGSVSGTTITLGTYNQIGGAWNGHCGLTKMDSTHAVVAFTAGSGGSLTVGCVTLSGTTVSAGAGVVTFNNAQTFFYAPVVQSVSSTSFIVAAYSSPTQYYYDGTISGTTVTKGSTSGTTTPTGGTGLTNLISFSSTSFALAYSQSSTVVAVQPITYSGSSFTFGTPATVTQNNSASSIFASTLSSTLGVVGWIDTTNLILYSATITPGAAASSSVGTMLMMGV